MGRWDRLFRVSYDLTAETTKFTHGWVTFEVDVEGDTTEFVRALSRALVDVVVVHCGEAHIPESGVELASRTVQESHEDIRVVGGLLVQKA